MKIKEYEKEFQNEEIELLVLIQKDIGAASVHDDYLLPSANILASIDLESGNLSNDPGLLEWMIKKDSKRSNWGFDLKGMTIYRVRVRRRIDRADRKNWFPKMSNRYLLLEILESDVQNDRLDEIRKEYQKPVTIGDDRIGYFTLNRDYEWFEGEINWLGKNCDVRLELDENATDTADNSLNVLRKLIDDLEELSIKYSRFAAEKLVDLANEWQDEYDEEDDDENAENTVSITKEDFVKRIEISEISIEANGDLEITYLDDDMFFGHWIVVYANISGELKDADIEG